MPLTKVSTSKQSSIPKLKLTISVPLTLSGIDRAYEQLERAKVRVQAVARIDLERLFADAQSRGAYTSEKQLATDIEAARGQIWLKKHQKRR